MNRCWPIALLAALAGCRQLDRRREPDMLVVRKQDRLPDIAHPRVPGGYVARVTPKAQWQVHSTLAPREAIADDNLLTAATATQDYQYSQWVLIDLGRECCFHAVRQTHANPAGYPTCYRIDTGPKEGFPYDLQWVGSGSPGLSVAVFHEPVKARFLRITVIKNSPQRWSLAEVDLE